MKDQPNTQPEQVSEAAERLLHEAALHENNHGYDGSARSLVSDIKLVAQYIIDASQPASAAADRELAEARELIRTLQDGILQRDFALRKAQAVTPAPDQRAFTSAEASPDKYLAASATDRSLGTQRCHACMSRLSFVLCPECLEPQFPITVSATDREQENIPCAGGDGYKGCVFKAGACLGCGRPDPDSPSAETPTPQPAVVREESGDGVSRIAAERQRQISVEGWTPEHDDEHKHGELADAGAAYAMTRRARLTLMQRFWSSVWPWERKWWKPTNRIRDLEKAGALIAAEIDRLLRYNSPADAPSTSEEGA